MISKTNSSDQFNEIRGVAKIVCYTILFSFSSSSSCNYSFINDF